MKNWGATEAERAAPLPCDALMPGAPVRLHRAVSVRATGATVFRWLCQMRIAPYSYDLLDNFGKRSPRALTPGLEHLEAGQRFMRIFVLDSFAPGEHLTLRAKRTVVTYAVRDEVDGVRILVRILFDLPRGAGSAGPLLAFGDWVMMRKQLLTLKTLAEATA